MLCARDVVVLAVKPQYFATVLGKVGGKIKSSQLVISIAGKDQERIGARAASSHLYHSHFGHTAHLLQSASKMRPSANTPLQTPASFGSVKLYRAVMVLKRLV
jgi:hypothetical protein